MLINVLAYFCSMLLTLIFGWLPNGSTLPTFGDVNLDTIFSTGIRYVKFLAVLFPPLTTIISAASIYIGFRLVLIVIKIIIGSRTPAVNS